MSLSDAKKILEELHKREVFDIVITGGEPSLNFSVLLNLVKQARDFNMGVSVNSNLTLINNEMAKSLYKAGVKNILTSVLGPNKFVHDNIAQKKGVFRKVMNGISIVNDNGINVSVNMVVSKLNLNLVRGTAKLVAEKGIKSFFATKAGCPGGCSNFSELDVGRGGLIKILEDLLWVRKNFGLDIGSLESLPLCGIAEIEDISPFLKRKCGAGICTMTIAPNGDVRPCPHEDTVYGNILKESFEKIWKEMNCWREGEQHSEICKKCGFFTQCGGGCRMSAKTSFGRLQEMDPCANINSVNLLSNCLKKTNEQKEIRVFFKENSNIFFKLNKNRFRKESFGGVIHAQNGERIFLSEAGIKVFLQIISFQCFGLQERKIDWGRVDKKNFINRLIESGVLSVSEQGGCAM